MTVTGSFVDHGKCQLKNVSLFLSVSYK